MANGRQQSPVLAAVLRQMQQNQAQVRTGSPLEALNVIGQQLIPILLARQQQQAQQKETEETRKALSRAFRLQQGGVPPVDVEIPAKRGLGPDKPKRVTLGGIQGTREGAIGALLSNPQTAGLVAPGIVEALFAQEQPTKGIVRDPTKDVIDPVTGRIIAKGQPKPADPSIDRIGQRVIDGAFEAEVFRDERTNQLFYQLKDGSRITVGSDQLTTPPERVLTGELTTGEKERFRGQEESGESAISSLSNLLGDFTETPGAGGLKGLAVEKLGGLLGQLAGPQVEEAFSRAVAGAGSEQVKAVRTRAQAVVSQMLTTITQETSGRFTDVERAIANRVLSAMDPIASAGQIKSALRTVIELSINSRDRASIQLGNATIIDVSDLDAAEASANRLMNIGFTEDEALDLLNERKQSLTFFPQ